MKRKAIEGVDERMMNDTQHGLLQEMQQIAMNARKYALLKILENPEITEVQKIEHITQHEKNGDSKNSQNSKYMSEIFKGAMPFVLMSLGVILLLTVFPGIALWLPNTMIH